MSAQLPVGAPRVFVDVGAHNGGSIHSVVEGGYTFDRMVSVEPDPEMIAKLINLMAVDSAGKGNGMWQIADAVGQVLIAMQARVDEGKSWNVTAQERETMIENVMKMDKHLRTWTVRRFNINAMAVNEINNRAKAEGYKRGQRVEIQL